MPNDEKIIPPNYRNARGRAAANSNEPKNEQVNPDVNPGHIQQNARPGMEGKSAEWDENVDRKLVMNPNPPEPGEKKTVRAHGIRII